jgi:benzoyl-CoA reductase/2-hydroxyglutaryl-CoA dehydratase subunit BcrC/BadD/HgdB
MSDESPAKFLDFFFKRGILGENLFTRIFRQTVAMDSPIQIPSSHSRPIIACLPLYPPLELLDSLGLHPIIPWNLKRYMKDTSQSDRHVQNYVCSVARHLVEYMLTDGIRVVDGIVAYNACDTLRNVPEIIQSGLDEKKASVPVFTCHIPMTGAVGRPRPDHVREYIKNEIQRITEELEIAFDVAFSPTRFLESVDTYNAVRGLFRTLSDVLSEGRIPFSRYVSILSDIVFMQVPEQFSTLQGYRSAQGTAR